MKHKGWIKSEHVRPGDVIHEYRGYASGAVSLGPTKVLNVVSLKFGKSGVNSSDDHFAGHNRTLYYGGTRKLEWLVERDELDFGPAISRTPTMVFNGSKKVNEYPDFCTRCGLPAYVGLFEIAHKNEAAAKDCPARRK